MKYMSLLSSINSMHASQRGICFLALSLMLPTPSPGQPLAPVPADPASLGSPAVEPENGGLAENRGRSVISILPDSVRIFFRQPDWARKEVLELTTDEAKKVGSEKAIRLHTLQQLSNVWDAQVCEKTAEPIRRGQPGMVRFWARTASFEKQTQQTDGPASGNELETTSDAKAQLAVYLQRGAEPWDKSLMTKLQIQAEWKLFEIPFRVHDDFAAGEAQLCLGLGFSPQTIDLAAIELLTYPMEVELDSLPSSISH